MKIGQVRLTEFNLKPKMTEHNYVELNNIASSPYYF
jgi:hypothetical protein